MTGRILSINVSPGGLPKRPLAAANLTPRGVEGDSWAHPRIHGGPEKAVLVLDSETLEELSRRGYPVYPGALGENLTTAGLDRRQLRIGQLLRAGEAWLEITRIRVPCASLEVYGPAIRQEIYDQRVKAGDVSSPRWGMSGFYARVIRPGTVHAEDIISVVATLA
ncbi:MAG: MOSC domain-containing protein [Bryobacteraceae bacterium]